MIRSAATKYILMSKMFDDGLHKQCLKPTKYDCAA